MVTCETCGSQNFEKHEGFLYCAVCQMQSQDYHEQEYDYRDHEFSTIRQKKTASSSKSVKQKFYDDGMWTTWEALNYILFGMTEELKKLGVTKEFETMVFKLWAAYLRECQAVFLSTTTEKIPKLGINFKQRDARILYNVDVTSRKRRFRSRSVNSMTSNTSASSTRSSKRLAAVQKRKLIQANYQDLLSESMQSSKSLANETLESLGKSSFETSDESESLVSSFKKMLRKKDYKLYRSSCTSDRLLKAAKTNDKKDVKVPGKNKLLCIIHLALLMTGSPIQLSDLLRYRFIREGHLSFAKVTHFFPRSMRLPKNDLSYLEVTSDLLMPTHLHQRRLASQLACLLKIEQIPTADTEQLIDRYCLELNLPGEVAELSKKVLRNRFRPTTAPLSKRAFPSYEAWAMVGIVFVLKLLLGLNDRTEVFLSRVAREVNRLQTSGSLLFVFEDWQKFIECRKTVLSEFHYPTSEQLNASPFQSSAKFLGVMMKESKDEYRNERFIPYPRYYIAEELLNEVKHVLNTFLKPHREPPLEFQPSLTPLTSHTQTILRGVTDGGKVTEEGARHPKLPFALLEESFRDCSVEFAFDPGRYADCLGGSAVLREFGIGCDGPAGESSPKEAPEVEVLLKCSSRYWTLRYPSASSGRLGNFREEVLEKTPRNFQWVMTECARMVEMNVRDVYEQLLCLEEGLRKEAPGPEGWGGSEDGGSSE